MVVTAAILFGLLPVAVFAQEGQKVTQVVITGNKNINRDTIANEIKLEPGADYTKVAVDKDRAAINATGYFSAVSVRTEETPEGLRVIYDVVENPIIKDIQIVGEGPISTDTVEGLMRTQAGQVLNTSTLNIDIEAIQRKYRDDGYVAYVTEDIGIDRETGVLSIPILVHTVQSVDIVGNKKTLDYIFFREMKTKPGQVFNMKILREDVARIYNLDILEDIQAPKIEPGADPGKLSIALPVTEKKTGSVSLGLGYSSQKKLVGRAELSETNLRGRGQGLTLMLETGTSDSEIGSNYSYDIGYHEPWVDAKHTSLSVDLFNKLNYRFSSGTELVGGDSQVNGQQYNERRKGAEVGLSRPLSGFTRAFVTVRGENVETTPVQITGTSGSFAPASIQTRASSGSNSVIGMVQQDGSIQSGTFRLLNNTRDFERDPADGWYKSVSLQIGNADIKQTSVQDLTPDVTDDALTKTVADVKGPFQKLQFDVRKYWSKDGRKVNPNDKRATIATRLMGGVAAGSLPFFEQYFVGGAESIRGYSEDRFWGDKMLTASVEYRKPVGNSLTGVAFLDYGDAWGAPGDYNGVSDLPQSQSFHGNVGMGIGLRVNTPIGNLRLDYGIGSEGGRTHFSMGQAF